jgi:hypothetical protein
LQAGDFEFQANRAAANTTAILVLLHSTLQIPDPMKAESIAHPGKFPRAQMPTAMKTLSWSGTLAGRPDTRWSPAHITRLVTQTAFRLRFRIGGGIRSNTRMITFWLAVSI